MKLHYQIMLLVAAATCVTCSDQNLRVLFVGNSYTYVNDLPSVFKSVAESMLPGVTVTTTAVTRGSARLYDHSTDTASQTSVRTTEFDVLVLQEQSQVIGFWTEPYPERDLAEKALDSLFIPAAEQNKARIVFYETWGRRNGDSQNMWLWPEFEDMECPVSNGYANLLWHVRAASCVNATIAPVGSTFSAIFFEGSGDDPTADGTLFSRLYQPDGSHPSVLGTFLAAMTIFGTVFESRRAEWLGRMPVLPAGVSQADGAVLVQYAASETEPLLPELESYQGFFYDAQDYYLVVRGRYIGYYPGNCQRRRIKKRDDGTFAYGDVLLEKLPAGVVTHHPLRDEFYCSQPRQRQTCSWPYSWSACETEAPATPAPLEDYRDKRCPYNSRTECEADPRCAVTMFSSGRCEFVPKVAPFCEGIKVGYDSCKDYACDLASDLSTNCISICQRFNKMPDSCRQARLEGTNGYVLTCGYDTKTQVCDQLTPEASNHCSYDSEELCNSAAATCTWSNSSGACESRCSEMQRLGATKETCLKWPSCSWSGSCKRAACLQQESKERCHDIWHCLWGRGQCWPGDAWEDSGYECMNHKNFPDDCKRSHCVSEGELCYPRPWVLDTFAPAQTTSPDTEAPMTEAPLTMAPNTNTPMTEVPITGAPLTMVPNTNAPRTEAPNTDTPRSKAPDTGVPGIMGLATEVPKSKAPNTQAPFTVAPNTDAPKTEVPITGAPLTMTLNTNAPKTEAEEPTKAPNTEAPRTEAPNTDTPRSKAPSTQAPFTVAPNTEAPKTQVPIPRAPLTMAPNTNSPKTEAEEPTKTPNTEAPRTEAPNTDTPRSKAPDIRVPEVPRSKAPNTQAPFTVAPNTEAPKTEARTAGPDKPEIEASTNAPRTEVPSTGTPSSVTGSNVPSTPPTEGRSTAATTKAPATLAPTTQQSESAQEVSLEQSTNAWWVVLLAVLCTALLSVAALLYHRQGKARGTSDEGTAEGGTSQVEMDPYFKKDATPDSPDLQRTLL